MKNVVVLASGGIDSTACLVYYRKNGYSPTALWVDYGQVSKKPELKAIKEITKSLDIPLKIIKIDGIKNIIHKGNDEVRGRNLLLGSIGISYFPFSHGLISMGIHLGTDYRDCTIEFQEEIISITDTISDGRLAMDFPFGSIKKSDIGNYCIKENVPISLTYSCLNGTDPPCQKCEGCQDRNWIFPNE